jgi:hypothetical protein
LLINYQFHLESLTNYVFPGLHERGSYSCDKHEECGNNDGFECGSLTGDLQYKVCKCEDGSLLDPKTQTCGKINIFHSTTQLFISFHLVKNQCVPECQTNLNFECRDYKCVCKTGYYLSGSGCSK